MMKILTIDWVSALPASWQPYMRLGRFDRPIGSWLLFWPCAWGLGLAAMARDNLPMGYFFNLLVLFGLGAIIMRAAGCVYNDLIDRKFDAHIGRTQNRPLPSGEISPARAAAFMIVLCFCGLLILLQLDIAAIALGFMSLAPVAIYPFMKRITWWPQLFLGLAFNWGALIGYAAFVGNITAATLALYGGAVFWTLGYDTIYAHQDREEDALIGVKSAAIKLGTATRPALAVFYALAIGGIGLGGFLDGLGALFWLGLCGAAAHFFWQVKTLDINNEALCLQLFKSNRVAGFLVAFAIALGGL